MTGLRQRKKQAAMRHIQQVAVTLFQEQGFAQVTVEQIAAAAEVSPSSIYRYFGTKEGLVFHDEHDDFLLGIVKEQLAAGSSILGVLRQALAAVSDQHFVEQRAEMQARTKLWMENRSIQAAAGMYLQEIAAYLIEAMVAGKRYNRTEAMVIAAAFVHGVVAGVQAWYEDGATEFTGTVYMAGDRRAGTGI